MMHTMNFFEDTLICKTSTLAHGDMSFHNNNAAAVITNREQFLATAFVLPHQYVPMLCNHGDAIETVTFKDTILKTNKPQDGIKADAIVTQEKGIALFLLTADCLPVCFYDPATETIALAHVSRVTFGKQLPQKVIQYLRDNFTVNPETVRIYIGPHIHKESYSFPLPLAETDPLLVPYMHEVNGRVHIDLSLACTDALIHTGVLLQNITISPIDTATSKEHFSFFNMKQTSGYTTARIATIVQMR
jgi:polyphenol oxidase